MSCDTEDGAGHTHDDASDGLASGPSEGLSVDAGAASPLVDSVEMVDIVFVERFGPTRSMVSKRAREPVRSPPRAPR